MCILEQAHGLEEAELVRLVGELAQKRLPRLVPRRLGGLLLGEHRGHSRGVPTNLALERVERVQHIADGKDARAFGIVLFAGRRRHRDLAHRGVSIFQSTDRAPMRGGQVLMVPRVCDTITSCVKLFMLA